MRFKRPLSFALLVAVSISAGAVWAALGRTDGLLISGLERALATQDRPAVASLQPRLDGFDPRALRLSRFDDHGLVGIASRLTPGDRITIAGADGRSEGLEVINVQQLPADGTRISAGPAAPRLLMITNRVVGANDNRLVRLIVEAEAAPLVLQAAPKAL